MAQASRVPRPKPELTLAEVSDDIVACRAGRHRWPSDNLQPGTQLPRGFRPVLQLDGCVQITESCYRCGKTVSYLTGPGGTWQYGARRRYADPEQWKTFTIESGITKSSFRAELYRRVNEQLMTAARANMLAREAGS